MSFTGGWQEFMSLTLNKGTTGVACANTGRNFIGMELDAGYFQIAKDRIHKAMP